MNQYQLAKLKALAQSWDDFVHAQGTETEELAHEAFAFEKCRQELLALLEELQRG